MPSSDFNLLLILPVTVIALAAVAVLMVDVFAGPTKRRALLPAIALSGLGLAAVVSLALGDAAGMSTFFGFHRIDRLGLVGSVLAVVSAAATIFMGMFEGEDPREQDGESMALVLLVAAGAVILATANELLMILIGIEIVGLSLYALAGGRFLRPRANEASFKYFILGAFSSALMVFGIAFLYGATGTTVLSEMSARIAADSVNNAAWLQLGTVLLFAGFCFKLTLAPFHMYAPDVYEGAPTPIASLIATASKAGGFVALWHLFSAVCVEGAGTLGFAMTSKLAPVVFFAAFLSMIVGNLGAFVQSNLKRLLAYSSVAHAGYASLAFVALIAARADGSFVAEADAYAAFEYYLIAYTFMNLLGFGVLALIGSRYEHAEDLQGLFGERPFAAGALALSLVALTGLPPTLGFFAKWQVFLVAIETGYLGGALAGGLLSIFSAYYYLRPVVLMFFGSRPAPAYTPLPGDMAAAMALDHPVVRGVLLAGTAALLLGPFLFYF